MCMHAQEVSISNKIYKKACNIFQNGRKKLSLQNVVKNLFETHYSLEKSRLQVPKMVPPPIKKLMVRPLSIQTVVHSLNSFHLPIFLKRIKGLV